MLKLLILLMSFVFLSCNVKESDQDINELKDAAVKEQIQVNKVEDTVKIKEIVADDFIAGALKNDLSLAKLQEIYKPENVQEQLVENRHYPEKTDTIVSFKSGRDFVKFHKGWGNVLPVTITIMSDKVVIDKDIRIGSSKQMLMNKLKHSNLSDTLVVSDSENGNFFTFVFQNKLIKFHYNAEYID